MTRRTYDRFRDVRRGLGTRQQQCIPHQSTVVVMVVTGKLAEILKLHACLRYIYLFSQGARDYDCLKIAIKSKEAFTNWNLSLLMVHPTYNAEC